MMEEMNTFKTYCIECDAEVITNLTTAVESMTIRGEETTYTSTTASCPRCGSEIGDSRIEAANLEHAYAAYRKAHNILSPSEIKGIRAGYGLSVREFSKFLGFGEQTVARYESGSLPTAANNAVIRMAETPGGARELLRAREGSLSSDTSDKVRAFIDSSERGVDLIGMFAMLQWPPESSGVPSPSNGYRGIDLARVAATVRALAERCTDLYKTKLQKAMFFCDFLSFDQNSRSLTGLCYAHACYGPVMDDKDTILYTLRRSGVIDVKQRGWGEVVIPDGPAPEVLDNDDLALIDRVAAFVNTCLLYTSPSPRD